MAIIFFPFPPLTFYPYPTALRLFEKESIFKSSKYIEKPLAMLQVSRICISVTTMAIINLSAQLRDTCSIARQFAFNYLHVEFGEVIRDNYLYLHGINEREQDGRETNNDDEDERALTWD
jgi:hypothetical protein